MNVDYICFFAFVCRFINETAIVSFHLGRVNSIIRDIFNLVFISVDSYCEIARHIIIQVVHLLQTEVFVCDAPAFISSFDFSGRTYEWISKIPGINRKRYEFARI